MPRWPVRSSTTRARVANQPRVFRRAVDRHDVIEPALAGDDERRRGDARAVGREIDAGDQPRARGHPRRATPARDEQRAQLPSARTAGARRRRECAAQISRRSRQRRLGEEQRAEDPRRAQVDLMPRPQAPARPRRRHQDQRRCPRPGAAPRSAARRGRRTRRRRSTARVDARSSSAARSGREVVHARVGRAVAEPRSPHSEKVSTRKRSTPARRRPGACIPSGPEGRESARAAVRCRGRRCSFAHHSILDSNRASVSAAAFRSSACAGSAPASCARRTASGTPRARDRAGTARSTVV